MLTIEIPEWLQWAGLALAVAYAAPKALRAVVVLLVYFFSLADRCWPLHVREGDDSVRTYPVGIRGRSTQVLEDIVGWALGVRPVYKRSELDTEGSTLPDYW